MFNIFGPQVPQITADEFKKILDGGKKISLLDVRTPEEYQKTKIAGSINLPLDTLIKRVETIMPDKNQAIYVYCFSGSRSTQAVAQMIELGYKNVFNITSGLLAWRAKQFPLES